MAWANLVRSTSSRAVSSGSKICSKQSGNASKIRAAIYNYKVMLQTQTPPIYMMRVRTFAGLCGGVNNSLCNMVNKRSCHDFHSTTIASSSATSVASPPILPKGELDMFTDKAKEVIKLAQRETKRAGYKFVGPEMILLGLIGNDIDRIFVDTTDIATKVLYSMGIYLEDAREKVQEIFGYCGPSLSLSGEIPFRPSALTAFQRSLAEAQQLGHSYIGSEHLLLGLLRRGGDANRVLRKLGARPKHIRTQVMSMIEENAAQVVGGGSSGNKMPTLEEEYGLDLTKLADEKKLPRLADFVVDGSSGNKMPTLESLEKLGHNLTELAYKKKLKPFVDRKPLVNTVIQILGRPSKNIPCLVGEDGVGKTSIVEGLAQRIADFDVPYFLSKKKVINLGEYIFHEGNLMKLLEEIKECDEFIFFIDDVDQLENSEIDRACNILMPAVARGEVQCVVAATPDEYLHMMKFPALQRLFQPIKVPEATIDETFKILKGREERYGNRDEVCYTDEALVAAAHMSDQNIWHSFLPSKAIDLIDLAGESVSRKEKRQASVLRDQEMGHKINMLEIEQRMDDMKKKKNSKSLGCTVTKADIEDIISDIIHLHAILYRLFGDAGSYEELGGWSKLYKTFYDEEEF